MKMWADFQTVSKLSFKIAQILGSAKRETLSLCAENRWAII